MRFASFYLLVCVLVLTLAGCADQVAVPASTGSTTPSAVASNATLQTSSQQEVVVPEPSSNRVGTVGGRIISITDENGRKPIAGLDIYLGSILKSDQGVEGMVELKKATAPKARLDANGDFTFVDVPSGRYGLMLDSPQGPILLNKPTSGASMIIEIKGGDSVNLGELEYPFNIG